MHFDFKPNFLSISFLNNKLFTIIKSILPNKYLKIKFLKYY